MFPEHADIETSSDDYAGRFDGPTGTWFLEVQERVAIGMVDSRIRTALDVGGGHGQLARPLCARGLKTTVHGSDESCQRRISDLVESGNCEFRTANMLDQPWADGSFDAVLCFRLLTHCDRWQELVSELCRLARFSVIIDYPSSTSLNAAAPLLFKSKKRIEKNTREWTLFKHRDMVEQFARNGFRLRKRVGQFFLPMVLHRALKCRGLSAALESFYRMIGFSRLWGTPVIAAFDRCEQSAEGTA